MLAEVLDMDFQVQRELKLFTYGVGWSQEHSVKNQEHTSWIQHLKILHP
jgi:hypothetical protein